MAAVAATVVGAVLGARDDGGPASPDRRKSQRPAVPPRLSLERQVGELLVMSFDGTRAPAYIRRRLARGQGTGVILFAKNGPDPRSLHALSASLQRAARGGALIATDQEGGAIRSVPFAAPEAGQPALASPQAAADSARAAARDLRRAGINVNLAPVADVSSVPGSVVAGRAFPGGAESVTRLVRATVPEYRRERVAATLKHFPGLGAATANTDDGAVTVAAPRAELLRRDVLPFREGVAAGAPIVMASHALYPALDPDRLASQSPAVIRDLLRRRLGFRGVVVTDSIEAQAVLERSNVAVAAERSIAAGADLVLMTGSGSWNLVQPRLLRRARGDRRFRARVHEAAARVLALKRRLGLRAAGA